MGTQKHKLFGEKNRIFQIISHKLRKTSKLHINNRVNSNSYHKTNSSRITSPQALCQSNIRNTSNQTIEPILSAETIKPTKPLRRPRNGTIWIKRREKKTRPLPNRIIRSSCESDLYLGQTVLFLSSHHCRRLLWLFLTLARTRIWTRKKSCKLFGYFSPPGIDTVKTTLLGLPTFLRIFCPYDRSIFQDGSQICRTKRFVSEMWVFASILYWI